MDPLCENALLIRIPGKLIEAVDEEAETGSRLHAYDLVQSGVEFDKRPRLGIAVEHSVAFPSIAEDDWDKSRLLTEDAINNALKQSFLRLLHACSRHPEVEAGNVELSATRPVVQHDVCLGRLNQVFHQG